jgi:hypothetical protein
MQLGVCGSLAAVLFGLALGVPTPSVARHDTPRFAVLPLVVGETGLPDASAPSAAQRAALVAQLERATRRAHGGVAVAEARVVRALAQAGYDQDAPYRACAEPTCARRIGRALHVDAVVYGSVTRYMALIWGMDVAVVDVASGRVRGPFSLGYKGDYDALYAGEDALAAPLARTLVDAAARRGRG